MSAIQLLPDLGVISVKLAGAITVRERAGALQALLDVQGSSRYRRVLIDLSDAVLMDGSSSETAVQLAAAVGRPDAHAGELPVAYVQLKPKQSANEAELMAYLSERVPERAALPKSIVVIDQMPLTSVGKIFKPELRRRETEFALQQALHSAGVRVQSIRIEADPEKQGALARVELEQPGMALVAKSVLDRFPLAYRLT